MALKYLVDTWDAADYENHLRRINEANEAALYQHPNNEARRMTVQPQLYQQIHQQERGRIELPPLPAGRGGAERSAPVDRGYRPDASAEQQAPTVADIRAMAASMQGPPSPAAAAVPGPASVPAAQSTTPRHNYHR
ncbi:hypothetical protein TeGR_g8073 [Tetraparma gracilis]|uniref:Uncharacterized protein n=1 Tax=Tetraparma gracilis TaxID=2962635 RepID=A0ABQ6M8F7_9STRA|nr:hypothetical protein TeGR_g8073 [Tetraparma gracilis]